MIQIKNKFSKKDIYAICISLFVAVSSYIIALKMIYDVCIENKELQKALDNQQQMMYDKEKELEDMGVEVQRLNDLLYLEQNSEEAVNYSRATTGSRTFEITHYTHTGNNTASGVYPVAGRTVACNSLPFGTIVEINGHEYIVEDRGAMAGNVIDVFVDSESEAIQKGRYTTTVNIKE